MCSKLANLELKTKDYKYKINNNLNTLKLENYLPDFFNGELVGVKFHVLYGGVSDILLPDGGVPSINWTLYFLINEGEWIQVIFL